MSLRHRFTELQCMSLLVAALMAGAPVNADTEKSEKHGGSSSSSSKNHHSHVHATADTTTSDSSGGASKTETHAKSDAGSGQTDVVEGHTCTTAKEKPRSSASAKKGKSKFLDTPPCLTWLDANAETEPKAVILAVHGLGLHNGTYKDFGERMAKLGYVVYAVDVRGFGSWKAAQGREKVNFDDCLTDVEKTLVVVRKVHPHLPVFLLGESMGGAIALRVTALHPELVDGLISSVPAGDRFKQGETTLKVALKLITAPNKQFDVGTGVINQATKKAELKELWSQDPLARMNLSPKELVQFQSFMNENHDTVKHICHTPVLMVQGKEDKLVKPEGTQSLFNKIVSKDKEMLLIEHGEHLIFEEGQFDDQVIQDVDKWLKAHLEKKPSGQISSK